MFYRFDAHGRFAGTSDQASDRSTNIEPDVLSQDYIWNGAAWVYAPSVNTVAEPAKTLPTIRVSPVEFKLLFTAQERVAIKAARDTDAILDDFFSIIDDPRLTAVDLGLSSTQSGLLYLVSESLITEARREEIMQGQFQ